MLATRAKAMEEIKAAFQRYGVAKANLAIRWQTIVKLGIDKRVAGSAEAHAMARDFESLLVKLKVGHKKDVALWTKPSSEAGMARLEATLDRLASLATQLGAHVNESKARITEERRQ